MIKWKFEGTEMYFVSAPQNLDRDISKMAYANSIDPTTKITIINGDVPNPTNSDAVDSNGDPAGSEVPTVSVDAKKTKSRKATDELLDLPGDLADLDHSLNGHQPSTDLDPDSSTSDWFDDQRV
jgi:hypothetical protein